MTAPRLSVAGLMAVVGVVAFDFAFLLLLGRLRDLPDAIALFLVSVALPMVNLTGVAVLLFYGPTANR